MDDKKEVELRTQAIVSEIIVQRDAAQIRAANLAGEVAFLRERLKELETPKQEN